MKALILSDIHSNAEALRAIWARESDSEVIYCAGDVVDYGPQPAEVIEWLAAHRVHCVQGNHDARLLEAWAAGEQERVPPGERWWVHHNCRQLRPEHIEYLQRLPQRLSFELDGGQYLLQHRYRQDYRVIETYYHFDQFWREGSALPPAAGERRMIFGHTHRQGIHVLAEGALWLNPGSASYRRQDDPTKAAYYMVIEDGHIDFRHTAYDRGPLFAAAQQARPELLPAEWQVALFFFGGREGESFAAVQARGAAEDAREGGGL